MIPMRKHFEKLDQEEFYQDFSETSDLEDEPSTGVNPSSGCGEYYFDVLSEFLLPSFSN